METLVWVALVALVAPVGVAAALWFDAWCETRWEQRHEEPPSNLDRWDGVNARDELWP